MTGSKGAWRRWTAGVLLAAAPAVAAAETMTDALVSAYRNSGLLEQNRALLRAADEDVALAVSALYPVIDWAGTVTALSDVPPGVDDLTATLDLTARITLWDGGRNRLAIDAAKEAVLAAREGLVAVEQQVLLQAVNAYMQVIDAREQVNLRRNNIGLISRELQAARDRFEVGEITRTDVSLAEARLSLARSQLAQAEGDLAIAREFYERVVGRRPGELRAPANAPLPAVNAEEAKARAVRSHPTVRRAQRQVTIGEINVARAAANTNPTVTLSGRSQLDLNDLGDGDDGLSGSLSLQIGGPVYSGGRLAALTRQAVARAEGDRAGLLLQIEEVREEAGSAFARLLVARAVLESARRQVTAQQQAFDGTREEARLGARTTLDVLDAEQDLLDARAQIITADSSRIIAQYALLAAQGLLTVDYLRLGIPTYDPNAYYESVKRAPVASSPQGAALDRVIKSLRLEDR